MKNRLTFFLDNMHGFVGLECESCADGKQADIKAGFYPYIRPPCGDEIQNPNGRHGRRLDRNKINKIVVPPFATGHALYAPRHPICATGGISTFLAFVNYGDQYIILNEGAVDGKSKCNATEAGIKFKVHSGYSKKWLESMYRVSYELNADDSVNVYNKIKQLAENQDPNYQYRMISYNCLDFTRVIYETTTLEQKSFMGIYQLTQSDLLGQYCFPATYMLGKDTIETACSHPVLAFCAGYTLYGLYNWASNKISRCVGSSKFDPKSISNEQREKDLHAIEEAKEVLGTSIESLQESLNDVRRELNHCYDQCHGVTSKNEAYQKLYDNYRSIRDCIETCEMKLAAVNRLYKNYNSLSEEYCSTGYALKIMRQMESLPNIYQYLAKHVAQFNKEESIKCLK